ncbi:MAG: hypothetical protein DRH12_17715 [Deltaproteobacteria bacterium]|nr:MAG: hypothetical protein DRH12_17715 [Deltaproteobacteria bacterium]
MLISPRDRAGTIAYAGRFLIIGYLFLKHGQIPRYYLPKLLFKLRLQSRYIKREILNNEMYLDLKDEGLSRDLLKTGIREALAVKLVHQEVKPGDIVADIGANIGYYALLEARLVGDKGKVYAIEPVPENVELLRRNVKLNKYQNVEVFQLAIGNKNRTNFIYLSSKRNWSSMIRTKQAAPTIKGKIPVQEVTFGDFCLKNRLYPNFIRMDVEGYEVEVIEGMKDLLKDKRGLKILMEIHPYRGKEIKLMLKTLREHGFECKAVINEPDSPQLLIQKEPQFLKKMFNFCNERLGIYPSGLFNMTLGQLIESEFLSKAGWVHVLFERK